MYPRDLACARTFVLSGFIKCSNETRIPRRAAPAGISCRLLRYRPSSQRTSCFLTPVIWRDQTCRDGTQLFLLDLHHTQVGVAYAANIGGFVPFPSYRPAAPRRRTSRPRRWRRMTRNKGLEQILCSFGARRRERQASQIVRFPRRGGARGPNEIDLRKASTGRPRPIRPLF